jgi:hypothetical protein
MWMDLEFVLKNKNNHDLFSNTVVGHINKTEKFLSEKRLLVNNDMNPKNGDVGNHAHSSVAVLRKMHKSPQPNPQNDYKDVSWVKKINGFSKSGNSDALKTVIGNYKFKEYNIISVKFDNVLKFKFSSRNEAELFSSFHGGAALANNNIPVVILTKDRFNFKMNELLGTTMFGKTVPKPILSSFIHELSQL